MIFMMMFAYAVHLALASSLICFRPSQKLNAILFFETSIH